MRIAVSKDMLVEALQAKLVEDSAGLLVADVIEIHGHALTGEEFVMDRLSVIVKPTVKAPLAPVEKRTATGFKVRLATYEGQHL